MPNPRTALVRKDYNCGFIDTGDEEQAKVFFIRASAVCEGRSYLLNSLTGRGL